MPRDDSMVCAAVFQHDGGKANWKHLDFYRAVDYVQIMKAPSPRTIRHPQLQQESPRPVAPTQPALEDCCRSGCTPCIFDLYEDDMERYRARLAAWEARQRR